MSGNRTSRIWALSGALFVVLAYLATIPAANWMVANLSPVPLGFGQAAPAGVALAGLALALRDWTREVAGAWPTVAAMAAGVVLSYWIADAKLATASAVAFGVKTLGLGRYGPKLVSADSLAWSEDARRRPGRYGPTHQARVVGHKNCANCVDYAVWWHQRLVNKYPGVVTA